MALNGTLDHLIEEMERLYTMAEANAETARIAYENAKAEAKRLRDMLKVAGVIEEAPKSPPKPEPKPSRVNDETRQAVLSAIYAHQGEAMPGVPGSFTVTTLAEATPSVHHSSVRTAIHMLREEGVIRAVGKVPNSPRQAPEAYAPIIIDTLDPGELAHG